MTEYAKLVVSVDSRQVRTADSDLDKLTQTAGKTEKSTDQLAGAFRRLAGPLAAVISAREVAQAAESYTTLTNRLRLVTSSTEELVAAQDAVFAIAQESRQPLEATAELYQRIAANSQELGLSANEIVSIVDTVNKTLAISGSSAQSASGALVQLGQAFASGQLRGEELNAVLEAAPPLAKAIADGLGVTVGELRKLGAEGQLSADAVAQAIIKQGDAIDQAFSGIQATGGQALTVLGNSLTKLVGDLNDATGAGTLFGDTIIGLAEYIDSGALTDGIIETFNIWSATFDAASQDIASLGLDLDGLQDAGSTTASFLADAFQNMPANLRAAVQIATVEVANYFDRVKILASGAAEQIKAFVTDGADAAAGVAKTVADQLQANEGVRQQSISDILAERDAILSAAEASRQKAAEERKQREQDRAARQAQIAELRKGLQGRQISLGGAGDTDKSVRDAERTAERLQQLFQSNEQGMARQVALFGITSEAARLRYEVENGELAKLNTAQQQRLIGLAEEIDRLNRIKKERDEAEATAEYTAALRDQIAARRNAIDIEVEAIGMGEKQAETLRQLNELEFEYARRLEELARVQGTSAALSAEAYQQRVEALRKAMEEEIKIVEEGEKRKDAARNDALAGARKGFQDYINNAADLAGQFEDLTGSALQGLEDQIVEFVMTGKASFKDLANAILADFVRIGTRQLIAGAASSLLGAFGGGSGGTSGGGYKGAFSFDGGGFTGLSPRAGGLDGKGGFLAMLHPQETVVDHARGQSVGGNSTTIGNVTMVFPDIKTAKEAQQATAVGSRQLAKAIQGFARHT